MVHRHGAFVSADRLVAERLKRCQKGRRGAAVDAGKLQAALDAMWPRGWLAALQTLHPPPLSGEPQVFNDLLAYILRHCHHLQNLRLVTHSDQAEPSPLASIFTQHPSFIPVSVRMLWGKTVSVLLPQTDTVDALKGLLQESQGLPPDQQRLIFAGRQLEDGRTLRDYHIEPHATVFMVLRLD